MALRAETKPPASQLSIPALPPFPITGIFQSLSPGATALSPLPELPGQPCHSRSPPEAQILLPTSALRWPAHCGPELPQGHSRDRGELEHGGGEGEVRHCNTRSSSATNEHEQAEKESHPLKNDSSIQTLCWMELQLSLLRPSPGASIFLIHVHSSSPETLLGTQAQRPAGQDTRTQTALTSSGGPSRVEETAERTRQPVGPTADRRKHRAQRLSLSTLVMAAQRRPELEKTSPGQTRWGKNPGKPTLKGGGEEDDRARRQC